MYRNPQLPSLTRRIGISLIIGLTIALIGTCVEVAIGHQALLSLDSIDDVIIGVLAAGIVFAYEQHRYRATMDKIRMISAMNHHVRNALQAISYAPYTEQEKQIKLIAESVSRIDWALREILPGETDPSATPQPEPTSHPASATTRSD